MTVKVLGFPKRTLENWVRQVVKGKLTGADAKPVSAEQMELARLRAELALVKMERDIKHPAPRGGVLTALPKLLSSRQPSPQAAEN